MDYIKITNGVAQPYSIGKLRRDNKNVSFPKRIPSDTLADYGVHEVTVPDAPAIDNATQAVDLSDQPAEVDGKWAYTWVVRDKTDEELAFDNRDNSVVIRRKRDELLRASDWTQVSDAPVDKTAWALYRQALRDISTQSGFPNNITWPTEPNKPTE